LDVDNLAKALTAIEEHKKNRLRVIAIEDDYGEYDEVGLMTAIKTFKDYGWMIYIASPGTRYRQWYREAHWMSIRLEDTAWAPFTVNEIIFPFTPGTTEPILPKTKSDLFMYVVVDSADLQSAFAWVRESKWNWTIEPNGLEGLFWQYKEEIL
jgi:hypothetical protein